MKNDPGKRGKVLVVEDDLAIRRLVRMILERHGYRVDVASDGAEAGSRIRSAAYDVIILDLMMPRLDGFALMDQLASEDPDKLRRIIVTSAASPSLIRERMRGAPFDLLPKPFDISDLANRVDACRTAQM